MEKRIGVLMLTFVCMTLVSYGQQKVDMVAAYQDQKINVVNRTLSLYENSVGAMEMNAAEGDGLAILQDISFSTGSIEIELLGENSPGRSFIGLAFNIQDEETFEAIYFRPFNFVAEEQIRKDHMVQYINHPDNTWRQLRRERTGEFENEIPSAPDPYGWFRATIKISKKYVEVRVDDVAEPVLKVERLSTPKSDRIGLWVGYGSSGRFQNLTLF